MTTEEEIFQQHSKIGFPLISEKEQASILIWHDVEIINRLTPGFRAEFIPANVVKRYITLPKVSFRRHFINSGYIEKLNETHKNFPTLDSQWVEKLQI